MQNQPDNKLPSSEFLKTDGAKTKSNAIEVPSIALPKGGGALKGIDEKFSVNASNGTSSFSIPLPLSPSRGGFQPSISLGYNSGAGNGIFGLGWNADIPSIQRKTDKKLPRYFNESGCDVFMFSGSEDLVPEFKKDIQTGEFINNGGDYLLNEFKNTGNDFTVRTYRPRIEGGFAKIERIQPLNENTFYWKVTGKENTVTFFGITDDYRIKDPGNRERVFEWLPQFSFDDKGNCVCFEFKEENTKNLSNALYEQYRLNGRAPFTNRYIKRLKYGNKIPYYPNHIIDPADTGSIYRPHMPPTGDNDFMFEVLFDYGEHAENNYTESSTGWKARNDAFSNYKPGFEMRTYRLCNRVLMFHHFNELNAGEPTLVRSLDFIYNHNEIPNDQPVEVTCLSSILQKGYMMDASGNYHAPASLPPLVFEYQPLKWNTTVRQINEDDLVDAPVGLGSGYQWTDFYNEGIAGILTEQADAWYYKSNLGEGKFSTAQMVSPKPSLAGLASGSLQLMDLDANGSKQIVSFLPGLQGYFELGDDNDWLPFHWFRQMPNIDLNDANTRLIDLNGDGKGELLITEAFAFRLYPSKGTAGYDSSELVPKTFDEEKGPAILFADDTQSIYLADMSGDGLPDIVRIDKPGSVCYWPNLGYGRFGAKVNMGAIHIADPFSFDHAYLQLADVSGTGATDIIYLGNNKGQVWINQSGNSFSEPCTIEPFWQTTKPVQINIIDLLGNGTGCIVWSSPLAADKPAPMRYIDLMGGKKPHIMASYKNGMGKTTIVEYKSSTQYFLGDKKGGAPWVTKLPFPVQCVNKVEMIDEATDLRFVTKYTYHHGYYDHEEREFRGFGRVDQTDTEEYEYLKNSGASNAADIRFHEPPVLTKTWYHTGAYIRNKKILNQFEKEYWYRDVSFAGQNIEEHVLPDALVPEHLIVDELREAYRACKGMVLRTEVFSLDQSSDEKKPYSVATHNCTIRRLQPMGVNAHAVFLVHESEAINFSYERDIEDPRIAHTLNLEIDGYGNVLKAVSVVYGREPNKATEAIGQLDAQLHRHEAFIHDAQTKEHVIYTETKVTIDEGEMLNGKKLVYHRLPMPWSVKTFEAWQKDWHSSLRLGGHGPVKYFTVDDFADIVAGNSIDLTAYQETFDETSEKIQLRLVEQVETLLLSYDLTNPLNAGKHGALGLSYESYQLAYTPALVDLLFNVSSTRVSGNEISAAKYCHIDHNPADTNWWIRSGKIQFFDPAKNETGITAQQRYYVPISYTDPFGTVPNVAYPANDTFLFIEKTIDAFLNTVSVEEFDYRVLAPRKMKDINDNLSAVSFDQLGMVAGVAMMGKGLEADDLENFIADLPENDIATFFANPFANGRSLLQNATARMVYDFNTVPVKVATISRETHFRKEKGTPAQLQYSFEYTGGLGNSVLKKIQAPKGKAKKIENGLVTEPDADPRWIGNGRTVLNNKGKPVKQYEPYFSATHLYEAEPALREMGVTPVLQYDAAGRLIRTDFPDGTFTKVAFDSWQQTSWDQNDTVNESRWASLRGHTNGIAITADESAAFLKQLQTFGGAIGKERDAKDGSLIHAGTPSTVLTDSLGRPFYTIAHNKLIDRATGNPVNEYSATRAVLDIEGNTRAVIDASDNTVMQYEFDMLGHTAHTISMDAGERWTFNDCTGKPTYSWDSKGNLIETEYDTLHRPTGGRLFKNNQQVNADYFEIIEYGTDKIKNLNGLPVLHKDTAGILNIVEANFKSNIKNSNRQLCMGNDEIPDWNNLSPEIFTSLATYDALGRLTESVSPHTPAMLATSSKTQHLYNESGLLDKVLVNVGNTGFTGYIKSIDYDAKGQRRAIYYGNNSFTKYEYDSETFRLRKLVTCPDTPVNISNFEKDTELKKTAYQFLSYTYDPIGNIINIGDEAQQAYYFNNQHILPENNYRYDALYRLTAAGGREHIGQNLPANAFDSSRKFNDFIPADAQPNAVNAFRNYLQYYLYDAVGNISAMQHIAGAGSWTRKYWYNNNDADRTQLQIPSGRKKNNQLLQTQIGNNTATVYTHDVHGNILQLDHLQSIAWNFKDQVYYLQIQASNDNENADGATYLYDGSGQRIRKQVTKGNITEERIYLGEVELFRKRVNNTLDLERETLHIMDDKSRIAMVETLTIENAQQLNVKEVLIRYQYGNHLGSASLELDGNARIISYEEYHPYGTTAYQNQNKIVKAAAKRYRYTGMERDEESGLAYHSARYYLPWLGRWLSADPIGIGDGVNVFCYCRCKPLTFKDLEGKAINLLFGGIGAGLGLIAGVGYGIYKGESALDTLKYGLAGAALGGLAGVTLGASVAAEGTTAGLVAWGTKAAAGAGIDAVHQTLEVQAGKQSEVSAPEIFASAVFATLVPTGKMVQQMPRATAVAKTTGLVLGTTGAVGGAKKIKEGQKDDNYWQMASGAFDLALSAVIVKGATAGSIKQSRVKEFSQNGDIVVRPSVDTPLPDPSVWADILVSQEVDSIKLFNISKSRIPSKVSVGISTTTGEIYYGRSGEGRGAAPGQPNLPESLVQGPHGPVPVNQCAEYAVQFKARTMGEVITNIFMSTWDMRNNMSPAPCANCQVTSGGATFTSRN